MGFDRLAWGRASSCHARDLAAYVKSSQKKFSIFTVGLPQATCIPTCLLKYACVFAFLTSPDHLNWDDPKTAVPMASVDFNATVIDKPTVVAYQQFQDSTVESSHCSPSTAYCIITI